MGREPSVVGRAEDLARVATVLDRAHAAQPGSVLVLGEAGVGKTALLRAATRLADARGFATAVGSCADGAAGTSFAPFRAALRALAGAYGEAELTSLVASAPALTALLPPALRPQDAAADHSLDAGPLYDAVLELVARLAGVRPLFFALDDLHWADRSSLELLSFLVRNLAAERVVLFGTARGEDVLLDDPAGRMLLECARVHEATRVDLRGLDAAALGDLVASVGADLDSDGVVVLHTRTGGNPFYALELLEAGAVHTSALPRSVTDTIALRLAALSPSDVEVVRAASVVPTSEASLIAIALDRDEQHVEASLRAAVSAGVLATDTTTGTVSFRHAIVREAVYGGMLTSERRRLHESVARVLEDRADTDASVLAHHYSAANRPADALRTSLAAARAAAGAYGSADALAHYMRAVDLWNVVPRAARPEGATLDDVLEDAMICALNVGAVEEGAEIGGRLLASLDPAREPERWALLAARQAELRWELNDAVAAEALLDRADEYLREQPHGIAHVRVAERRSFHAIMRGDRREGGDLARDALALARRVADDEAIVVALNRVALAATALGERDGQALLHEAFDAAWQARLPHEATRAAINMLLLLHTGCRLDDARAAGERVLAAAAELSIGPTARSVLAALYARALVDAGDWSRADELLSEIRLPNAQRYRTYVAIAIAEFAAARGDAELAQRMLAETRFDLVFVLAIRRACLEAELALTAGEPHVARSIADEHIPLAELVLDASYARLATCALRALGDGDVAAADSYADGVRRRGLVLHEMPAGPPADHRAWALAAVAERARVARQPAADCWAAAVGAFDDAGLVVRRAWAQTQQAAAMLSEGDDRSAVAALVADAHAVALRLGADPVRDAAEELVRRARLDVRGIARQASGDLGLTEREAEVLKLVATGSSNREIADALFISTKTASVHVSNILRKVGATTRGEAAAIAHHAGLVSPA